jgi:hypothetical protein
MPGDGRTYAPGTANAAAPTLFSNVRRVVFTATGDPPRSLTRRGEAGGCQVWR